MAGGNDHGEIVLDLLVSLHFFYSGKFRAAR